MMAASAAATVGALVDVGKYETTSLVDSVVGCKLLVLHEGVGTEDDT